MPLFVVLIVLLGILSGVAYGASYWQELGSSVLEAVFWGGVIGAGVSSILVGVVLFFHSIGKGIERFVVSAFSFRFWLAAFVGVLIAWSFTNLFVGSIAFGEPSKNKVAALKPFAEKMFQDPLTLDWTSWLEGFSAFSPWYVLLSLFLAIIAVNVSRGTPEDQRMPWYATLGSTLLLMVSAFPPTFIFAVYGMIAVVVIAFVALVGLLIFYSVIGSPEFFLYLHRKPLLFALFYSGIGGAGGTYVAIQTSILGNQAANSPLMISLGFVGGSVLVLVIASVLRRAFGFQWDPVFT